MNAAPATMAAIKALSASTAQARHALDELALWADERRAEVEARLELPAGSDDPRVLADPDYDAALDLVHRASLVSELSDNLLRDFTTRTTSNPPGGPVAAAPSARTPAPALPGGSSSGR